MKKMVLAALAAMLGADVVADESYIETNSRGIRYVSWDLSVTNGYYNDAANWIGGVLPSDGNDGLYGCIKPGSTNITIRFPAEGLSENSGFYFSTPAKSGEARTITFDTRGTYWEKLGANYANDWSAFQFYRADLGHGAHFFNFEGVTYKPDVADKKPLFKLTDAVLRFVCLDGAVDNHVYLDQGTFDTSFSTASVGMNGTRPCRFYLQEGSSYKGKLDFAASGNPGYFYVNGGNHTFSLLTLKSSGTDDITNPVYAEFVNSSRSTIVDFYIAYKSRAQQTDLDRQGRGTAIAVVSNQAHIAVSGKFHVGAGALRRDNDGYYGRLANHGTLILRDNATLTATCAPVVGYSYSTTGVVDVADSAVFTITKDMTLGNSSNSYAHVKLGGNGKLLVSGNINASIGLESRSEIALAENATLAAATLTIGSGADARGSLSLQDNVVLSVTKLSGVHNASFSADGGTIEIPIGVAGAAIGGLTSAEIGDAGLAVNAGSDLAVNQPWTGGTLTLSGMGVISLNSDSAHAKTTVAPDTHVLLADGVTFGETLELAEGSVCEVASGATAKVKNLSVATAAKISLNAGSSLSLESAAAIQGVVTFVFADDALALDTDYTVFTVADGQTLDASKFNVLNATAGKVYTLTPSTDGKSLSVKLTESAEGKRVNWLGAADNNWSTPSNWEGGDLPTHNDTAVIAQDAPRKDIAISADAFIAALDVSATDAVTVTGDKTLTITDTNALTVAAGGNVTLAVPLSVREAFNLVSPAATTVTVAKAIFNSQGVKTTFTKVGSGALVVSGANDAFDVDWIVPGGRNTFVGPTSWGVDTASANGLVLSNNTVRYEGDAATIMRPVRFMGEYPHLFDTAGDLTFRDFTISHDQADSGFVKTGVGTLVLDVPVGKTTLAKYDKSVRERERYINSGSKAWEAFAPSATGEITSWAGVAPLAVLEGTLHIRGKGRAGNAQSAVHNDNFTTIGGGYHEAKKVPELFAENVYLDLREPGCSVNIARNMHPNSTVAKLTAVDSWVEVDTIFNGDIREGNAFDIYPCIAATNATLHTSWMTTTASQEAGFSDGNSKRNYVNATYRVENAIVYPDCGPTCAFFFRGNFDIDFAEDSFMTKYERKRPIMLFFAGDEAKASFRDGTTAEVQYCLFERTEKTVHQFLVTFDDATLCIASNTLWSACAKPETDGFDVGANGMRLASLPEVTQHTFGMPFRGEGTLVKKGAFTGVFPTAYGATSYDAYTNTALPVLCNAGGLRVEEGTAQVHAGAVGAAYDIDVRAGAVLDLGGEGTVAFDKLTGNGVVSNGTVSATLVCNLEGENELPTFTDVSFGAMKVDFGVAETDILPVKGTFAIANLGHGAAFGTGTWKGVNMGSNGCATFAVNNGVLEATVKDTGLILIIR